MSIRARFAPSPTGQVHIGNIRTAIFNYLFTRHNKGEFLLRIEDTDLERSTKQAIDALYDCMKWLGLDYDGEVMYQTTQSEYHKQVAKGFAAKGIAYELNPGEENTPLLFRLEYACDSFPFVRSKGVVKVDVASEAPVKINRGGVVYSTVNHKGKVVESAGCLAGFKDLKVYGKDSALLFTLSAENIEEIKNLVEPVVIENAAAIEFERREVFFNDLVKKELSKPLDSIKDFIIIRSDGSPVFHLANVCDDITQKVTHIVRGDDHVENTYRHLFIFQSMGYPVPVYAHLPMIVNASGKPYSKRDGDAFVGDFREKGFLPHALFNYLALLGWSPGDDREKMSMEEMISAFEIEKAQHSAAQFDFAKLSNMNGAYIAEMPFEEFEKACWDFAERFAYRGIASREVFTKVAALMQSRTKVFTDIAAWSYFFEDVKEYDGKGMKKFLKDQTMRDALASLVPVFASGELKEASAIESAIRKAEETFGMGQGKLNQSIRVAVTGTTVGAGMYETIEILGTEKCAERITKALAQELPA